MTKIILKRGKEESLQRFHPWIFSGAIHHIEGKPEEGDVVEVLNSEGAYICTGHWQIGSIAVRVLSFAGEEIGEEFYRTRLQRALDVRRTLGLIREDNNTFRLVHGEGDFLPGLVIDIYGPTAVMQAHSVGMHYHREMIARALKEAMGDALEAIYYKSETTLPYKADLGQQNYFLLGGECGNIAIENGLRFHIDWLKGQKTGFFVDQRENRRLLEQYSHGRRVLNMFCYTGGFSVYAMRGGATLVHSVDSSAKAVDLVNANMRLNFPDDPRHQAFVADAFDFLTPSHDPTPALPTREGASSSPLTNDIVPSSNTGINITPSPCGEGRGGVYDLIILDPPAFAKHRDALRHALKGYTKLNARAMQQIAPGGILFTFSCSQAVDKDHFRTAVFTAAAIARRKVRILHQIHQPADHPINIYHPEGEYLKGLVLYVE